MVEWASFHTKRAHFSSQTSLVCIPRNTLEIQNHKFEEGHFWIESRVLPQESNGFLTIMRGMVSYGQASIVFLFMWEASLISHQWRTHFIRLNKQGIRCKSTGREPNYPSVQATSLFHGTKLDNRERRSCGEGWSYSVDGWLINVSQQTMLESSVRNMGGKVVWHKTNLHHMATPY